MRTPRSRALLRLPAAPTAWNLSQYRPREGELNGGHAGIRFGAVRPSGGCERAVGPLRESPGLDPAARESLNSMGSRRPSVLLPARARGAGARRKAGAIVVRLQGVRGSPPADTEQASSKRARERPSRSGAIFSGHAASPIAWLVPFVEPLRSIRTAAAHSDRAVPRLDRDPPRRYFSGIAHGDPGRYASRHRGRSLPVRRSAFTLSSSAVHRAGSRSEGFRCIQRAHITDIGKDEHVS